MQTSLGDRTRSEPTPEPDYGLVRPVLLPVDGRIPDRVSGMSSRAEYQFQILVGRL